MTNEKIEIIGGAYHKKNSKIGIAGRAEFQIIKIDFITKNGERISIDSTAISKLFKAIEYSSIREIIYFPWSGMNKAALSRILFLGIVRKIVNIEPRISGDMCLPLISPYIAPIEKIKEIIEIEVHIKERIFRFSLKNSSVFENLMCIKQVIYNNQYDLNKKNVRGKIIIDAGSYLG
ncbi:Uncharacterised protein [uncultured archaeon]|nr:Uncharacterised protein [uncultured archaeon]